MKDVDLERGESEVKAAAFFEKLLRDPNVQIPELLVMVNPDLREDVVHVA